MAIVTGGGNGLGRDYCLELAQRGAKIIVLIGVTDGYAAGYRLGTLEEVAENWSKIEDRSTYHTPYSAMRSFRPRSRL